MKIENIGNNKKATIINCISKRNKCYSRPLNIEKNYIVGQVFDLPANQHTTISPTVKSGHRLKKYVPVM